MSTLIERCRSRRVLSDGAMGTELQRAGLEIGDLGERWNLEAPDRVAAIHRAYLDAGAEVITTNSFSANPWVLGRYRLAADVDRVNRAAAVIARKAAGAGAVVLGDIGPFGGLLAPLGEVAIDDVSASFGRQARALLDGGADGIIVETMSAIEEAVAAVRAACEAGAPVVVASMAFERRGKAGLRTMMGVAPADAARALAAAGAAVVGANCGTGLDVADFGEIADAMRDASGLPVIVQPNAGRPQLVDGRAVYVMSPETFATGVAAIAGRHTGIVGGCCGTTPAHIAALAAGLSSVTT